MPIQAAQVDAYATFEALCQRIRPRIHRLVQHHLGNPQDAEDITQEALLRAWAHYSRFDPARSFDAWVIRIANNLCIDHLRRRRGKLVLSLDAFANAQSDQHIEIREMVDRSNDPAVSLLKQEVDERLEGSIEALPPVHRECVRLLAGGHTYEQIAALQGCPLGTVRSRVHRARARLYRAMQAHDKRWLC